jgi:CBS domain-containing protein
MRTPVSSLLVAKTSRLHTVDITASVSEAVTVMNENHVGSVLVLNEGSLAGIFTERDVLYRVVAAKKSPHSTSISAVMTRDVVTLSPNTTVEETMTLITEKRCRHLPILQKGRLIGIISSGDVTRWMVSVHRTEAEMLRTYINGSYG